MDEETKKMTMMRLGELHCFEEEQRIAIMEMVKSGSMTIEEGIKEVKRVRPKTFSVKYIGGVPAAAETLRSTLNPKMGTTAVKFAMAALKKSKDVRKVDLTISTVGHRIVEPVRDETIENEPIAQIAYVCVAPGDKKKVAYVTSYSRLGLVWVHLFAVSKAKDAAAIVDVCLDRQKSAAEQRSLVPASGIDQMSAGIDDEEEEDADAGAPLGVFWMTYLGNSPVNEIQGEEVVAGAVQEIREKLKAQQKEAKKKKVKETTGVPCAVVISSEGIRTVERGTKEIVHNVIIKAISYSTQILGKKLEMFAFIEVDDRRNTKTCHVFLCHKGAKGQALSVCNCLSDAFQAAVEEARARAGNPLLPMGRVREKVEGPLAGFQVERKHLKAIKAIGAGQFGKVFLAEQQGRQLAIKMLRGGASQGDRKEFLREAETMLSLGKHDNLVDFVGVAVQQRPWLVVLDFCMYGDLSDVLRACRRKNIKLHYKEQLLFAEQLAAGMKYIHSKGFVHMDLAARNCLLHGSSVIKVADFGLTHKYDEGFDYYKQVGVMKLSIRWLAIDSFDHKMFSEKSDVWSYAITLWEIMTYGTQPYHGNKLTEVLRMVRTGTRLEKPENCPDELFDVMAECWTKNRHKRPSFKALEKTMRFLADKDDGESPRDIGAVLNSDLNKNLKRMSVRVKKQASGEVKAPKKNSMEPVSEEGLTGVIAPPEEDTPAAPTEGAAAAAAPEGDEKPQVTRVRSMIIDDATAAQVNDAVQDNDSDGDASSSTPSDRDTSQPEDEAEPAPAEADANAAAEEAKPEEAAAEQS